MLRSGGLVALGCALAAPAHAQLAQPAAPQAPVHVWYRSSEGCPDGASFVERLSQLGRPAALAGVGDRVDFVITLAARAEASSGRLERQTERGTVAIREVESAACVDVAEALALSLELALEPAAASAAPDAVALPVSAVPPPADSAPRAARAPELAQEDDGRAPSSRATPAGLGLGAQGRLGLGLGPDVTPGAALFAELSPGSWLSAVRFGARGAYAESEVRANSVQVLLLAAELDACAWRWRPGALALEPCLGFDLGLLEASSGGARGTEDRGLWASARVLVRSRLALWPELEPELQLGLFLPFTRYVIGAPEGDDLFRVRAAGGELSIGARWAP